MLHYYTCSIWCSSHLHLHFISFPPFGPLPLHYYSYISCIITHTPTVISFHLHLHLAFDSILLLILLLDHHTLHTKLAIILIFSSTLHLFALLDITQDQPKFPQNHPNSFKATKTASTPQW